MKRPLLIGIAATLCVIVAVLSLSYYRRCYFTTPAKTYTTFAQAVKEGVIVDGWLPDFLPRTAYNIREKHNASHNTVIAAFSFDPSESEQMLQIAEELPKERLKTVRPSVICRNETWFPKAVTEGKFDQLSPAGFRIYRKPEKLPDGIRNGQGIVRYWHVLVHSKAGICYLWLN